MKIALLFIAASFITQVGLAHGGSVSGIVSNGQSPVAFATVGITYLDKGSVTDSKGQFVIDHLDPGTYQLAARAMGYTSRIIEISIKEGKEFKLEIVLEKNEINLNQ
ncbi:MAG: iron complex outermembrane receptor protein, partial [Flammeovirgaceae bacterium]